MGTTKGAITIGVLLLWMSVVSAHAEPPLRPDPSLTPGDVLTIDLSVICQTHYTDTARNGAVLIELITSLDYANLNGFVMPTYQTATLPTC